MVFRKKKICNYKFKIARTIIQKIILYKAIFDV